MPSGAQCEETAPKPYGDGSQDGTNSLFASKCTSKICDVSSPFTSLKALPWAFPQVKCFAFCNINCTEESMY